jgi:hypothetical protein
LELVRTIDRHEAIIYRLSVKGAEISEEQLEAVMLRRLDCPGKVGLGKGQENGEKGKLKDGSQESRGRSIDR